MGAPLPAVPNVLKAVLSGFVDNLKQEVWSNILHFAWTGSLPTNSSLSSLAMSLANLWNTNMASTAPSPTSLQSVELEDLSSSTGAGGSAFVNMPGTRGDDSIPANSAVLISYPVALRYKGGHPRTYVLALGNADLDGAAEWNPTAVNEVQTKWNNFINAFLQYQVSGTQISAHVAVRQRGKFLPNEGPPHYYLTSPIVMDLPYGTAQQRIATQRRRVRGQDTASSALALRRAQYEQSLTAGRVTSTP